MLFLPGEAPKRPSAEEIIQLILGSGNRSLSEEEFVIEGIKKLRKEPYKGSTVSSVGSMKPSENISTKTRSNSQARWPQTGKIEIIPLKSGKGVMLYLPGEGPRGKKTDEALKKILG